ncbi:uncharacterized protein LOC122543899 isoform X2 [Chiloscyllium plagiosum]|uniref:uncharacterized protein LOC122543899 isoform X2 n=1 Tax=Chiloscyllium plagiosum TaxID=36176 RepID=UPI001CB86D87|nr:uncharacterized protein LOC122543899 isoform X2 [Chiloscyllium plagiosum]
MRSVLAEQRWLPFIGAFAWSKTRIGKHETCRVLEEEDKLYIHIRQLFETSGPEYHYPLNVEEKVFFVWEKVSNISVTENVLSEHAPLK